MINYAFTDKTTFSNLEYLFAKRINEETLYEFIRVTGYKEVSILVFWTKNKYFDDLYYRVSPGSDSREDYYKLFGEGELAYYSVRAMNTLLQRNKKQFQAQELFQEALKA